MEVLSKIKYIKDENKKKWWILSSLCKEVGLENNTTNLTKLIQYKDHKKIRIDGKGQWIVVVNNKGLFMIVMTITVRNNCKDIIKGLREELLEQYKVKFND